MKIPTHSVIHHITLLLVLVTECLVFARPSMSRHSAVKCGLSSSVPLRVIDLAIVAISGGLRLGLWANYGPRPRVLLCFSGSVSSPRTITFALGGLVFFGLGRVGQVAFHVHSAIWFDVLCHCRKSRRLLPLSSLQQAVRRQCQVASLIHPFRTQDSAYPSGVTG